MNLCVFYVEKFNLVLVAVCCSDSMEIITERSRLIMKYSADWVNALNWALWQHSCSLFISVWQSSWWTHQYECSHPCRVCWWWGWGWGQCCGSCNKLNRWSIHRTEWWLEDKNTTWSDLLIQGITHDTKQHFSDAWNSLFASMAFVNQTVKQACTFKYDHWC